MLWHISSLVRRVSASLALLLEGLPRLGLTRYGRVLALLGLLLEGYLRLTADEVEDWTDQPEDYYLLQDSIEARESVRVRRRASSWNRIELSFESGVVCERKGQG